MTQILGTGSPDLFELTGAVGNIVYGFGGDDDFFDSVGNDWLWGGLGNDQFYTSAGGSDVIFGGAGDDEFNLGFGEENVMIRGGRDWDELIMPAGLLADGEANFLRYALGGVLLQMADGGILDLKGIEQVTLI